MTTLFVAAHDEKSKQTKKKNLLSNNREKGMYSNKAPFCLWLSFPFSSPPSLVLVLLNPIKKKRETVYCRLLTPTTTGCSPYYLIFRT